MRYIVILGIIALIIPGCISIKEEELYGEYMINRSYATEILVLNKDKSYEQTIILKNNSDTTKHTGKWKFSTEFSDVQLYSGLSIDNGFCRLDSNYNVPSSGYVIRNAYKYTQWNNIRLTSGCEEKYYEKIE